MSRFPGALFRREAPGARSATGRGRSRSARERAREAPTEKGCFWNLSIVGKKYTDGFNIKGQKADLWSGCSGIGLERWTVAFLAQKGLDMDKWPKEFQKRIGQMPAGIQFL